MNESRVIHDRHIQIDGVHLILILTVRLLTRLFDDKVDEYVIKLTISRNLRAMERYELFESKSYITGLKKSWKKVAIKVIHEYFKVSSIHGLKHLVDKKWHITERLLWGCLILCCMALAFMNIKKTYETYIQSPVITTAESCAYHISHIPFPGFALCNINKIRRSAQKSLALRLMVGTGYNFSETYKVLNVLRRFYFLIYEYKRVKPQVAAKFYHILDIHNQRHNITNILRELAHPCETMLKKCHWHGRQYPCHSMFKQTTSSRQGFCCVSRNTDNYKIFKKELWKKTGQLDYKSLEKGYVDMKTSVASKRLGISVEVDVEPDEYQTGSIALLGTQAIKVLVYDPHMYPDIRSGGVLQNLIPHKYEVYLHMSATAEYSSLEMVQLASPENRCKYHSEGTELFDGEYTFSGCLFQCRIKNITDMCGCVPYYIPDGSANASHCAIEDIPCLQKQNDIWSEMKLDFNSEESCKCKPGCNRTFFERQTTSHPITSESPLFARNTSVFHMYFDKIHTILYKKDVLVQWSDMISKIIGLCALFLGASVLSIVELLYFLTVRFVLELYGKETKSKKKQVKVKNKEEWLSDLDQLTLKKLNQHSIYWNEILAEVI